MPTAVCFLPVLIHKPKPVSLEECMSSGLSVAPLLLLAHSPKTSILLQLGIVASVFTRGCLKGVGAFLGIQDKPTPISRSEKRLYFH